MCGLVGAWSPRSDYTDIVRSACQRLRHRGPDSEGVWADQSAGVVLGHRRLAIVDLSEAGAQPMASASGRFHLAFNGEIYNHMELREQLGPRQWRGHSDTETLLACIDEWGFEKTLRSTVGMFALAAFDQRDRRLHLARDRFGEKPLYYGFAGDALIFGSEIKALRVAPGFDSTLDATALESYFAYGHVPAPHSIYSAVRKLPAGTWLEIDAARLTARELPAPRAYWSAVEVATAAVRSPGNLDEKAALDGLELRLREAVRGQMVADVPLGAFLSGGIDSATVVAIMQTTASRPVKTCTMGFDDPEFDESRAAAEVARHLGTDHTEVMVGTADVLAWVPRMAQIYDEPFADASQLPTCLVSQIARRHVTVALSGDGGDELFAGYNRHRLAAAWWPRISRVPRVLRQAMGKGLHLLRPDAWDRIGAASRRIGRSSSVTAMADKVQKLSDALESKDGAALYRNLVTQGWRHSPLAGAPAPRVVPAWHALPSLTEQMMLADTLSYLPDDVLTKVDRASMSVSLETRVPFLDHRLYEYVWNLPLAMRMRDGQGKWLLRRLLQRHVPASLTERPKMGFAPPLDEWLRGPLREWAENLLDPVRLRDEGYLDATRVRRFWDEHRERKRNRQQPLWIVLMFQAWLENER